MSVDAARASSSPPAEALDARFGEEANAHPEGARLGALALDVLARQAEGRALFVGKEHLERRAEEHGVARSVAGTSAGNLLGILERGAATDAERAAVAAFALRGLRDRLREGTDEERARVAGRFVQHAEFLELVAGLAPWGALDTVLDDADVRPLARALAQRAVDDGVGVRGASAASRARNAARITALARSRHPSADEALAALLATPGLDAATCALGASLAGSSSVSRPGRAPRLVGRLERARGRGVGRFFALLTGLALARWAVRGSLALVGARREAELLLDDAGLELSERTRGFGRVLREARSTYRLASLRTVAREVRYPRMQLYLGAIALALGVLVGGTWIFDGVRGGDLGLVSTGAALLLGGAVLDLALDVLVPARRGRVSVEVAVERGRTVRIGNVPIEDADRFVEALRARLARA